MKVKEVYGIEANVWAMMDWQARYEVVRDTLEEVQERLNYAELLWQTSVDNEGTQWAEDIIAAAKEEQP